MLTITDRAAEAIDAVVASTPNAPDTAGLRIARATAPDGQEGLALSLADGPAAEDAVVEGAGAPVFVDPEAAEILDDKVLDAQMDGEHVGFMLREQDGDTA